jgi:glycerol-3-phosphate cytidylyltransferase-like family protein
MVSKKIKRIVIFDFDGTLFFTPTPEQGIPVWEEKTGEKWPYNGWWGRGETLDADIFHIPINPYVYRKHQGAVACPDTMVVLSTGRLERMRDKVQTILDQNNLEFDLVSLCTGPDTYTYKSRLFKKLIEEHQPDVFVMYDDRHSHIANFKEWAKDMPCRVEIVDVTSADKKPFIVE